MDHGTANGEALSDGFPLDGAVVDVERRLVFLGNCE